MSLCWMDWDELFKWAGEEKSESVRRVELTYLLMRAAWWRHINELPEVWAAGFEKEKKKDP